MKVLDKMINEFTNSTKTGFSSYIKPLEVIRDEFKSLILTNHTLKIDNDHKQDVIDGLEVDYGCLEFQLKKEQSRTWWNKLWNTYPKS